MSQLGDIYRPKGSETSGPKAMSKGAHHTDKSETKTDQCLENEKERDEGWEVVEWPVVDEKEEHGPCDGCTTYRSQFKLELGWGSWRTTVFDWDTNVRVAS
ncbi:hypothetical protein ACET3X_007959 [Alternaria dauci]|uniref:Uncharacterized protein n=1 Tax=Alternaria dauci TaxID=48095 RepID=A0ABR3UDG1_9PLEO